MPKVPCLQRAKIGPGLAALVGVSPPWCRWERCKQRCWAAILPQTGANHDTTSRPPAWEGGSPTSPGPGESPLASSIEVIGHEVLMAMKAKASSRSATSGHIISSHVGFDFAKCSSIRALVEGAPAGCKWTTRVLVWRFNADDMGAELLRYTNMYYTGTRIV